MQKLKQYINAGFTLLEVLVVMAILVILTVGAIRFYVSDYLPKARDQERVHALNRFKKALAIFYQKYGHYPPARYAPTYNEGQPTGDPDFHLDFPPPFGVCQGYRGDNPLDNTDLLRYDRSNQYGGEIDGLLDVLKQLGLAEEFVTTWGTDDFVCRYFIDRTSEDKGNNNISSCPGGTAAGCFYCTEDDCPDPSTYKEIQRYYAFCRMEGAASMPNGSQIAGLTSFAPAQNDGGIGPCQHLLYEIYEPQPWLCVLGSGYGDWTPNPNESQWCIE